MRTVARASRSGLMFTFALVNGITLFIVACGEAATAVPATAAPASSYHRSRANGRPPRYCCAHQGSADNVKDQRRDSKNREPHARR